jgi:hypothetical protein
MTAVKPQALYGDTPVSSDERYRIAHPNRLPDPFHIELAPTMTHSDKVFEPVRLRAGLGDRCGRDATVYPTVSSHLMPCDASRRETKYLAELCNQTVGASLTERTQSRV